MPEILFKCPKCRHSYYEEIQVDITVATGCHLVEDEQGVDLRYFAFSNSDGYVDRYQCSGCGYTIIDHNSLFCEEGLDADALAKALKALTEKRNAES